VNAQRGVRALLAGDRRVTGGTFSKLRIVMGSGRGWLAGDWPSTGAFLTLLRQPGLWAFNGGILAT